MSKNDLPKEIRLNRESVNVRAVDESKMIIEGYPIIFDTETFIYGEHGGFYEKIDRNAFDNADMRDVALKYNHNDTVFILARTRNKSLTLTVDDKGVFMHAELIDTSTNIDVYKMVKSGLLDEGSFAFTVADDTEEIIDGEKHRTVKAVGRLFDVSICPNGAYSETEIYARKKASEDASKTEVARRVEILRLRNSNKMKLFGGKKQ